MQRLRSRLNVWYHRRRDAIYNALRAGPLSQPATDVFVLIHLAWLSFAAAWVRNWEGLGIALGVLFSVHVVLSFAEMLGPRR